MPWARTPRSSTCSTSCCAPRRPPPPGNAEAAALFRLGDYAAARASFQRALELDPSHYPALNGLGVDRLNQYLWSDRQDEQALQEAIAYFRKSLQIEHNQPRIRELLSRFT
ncbi:MAG: hypothetical protein KatS3mg103_0401 [Phycisphaerales bacterium]|nr:MAG: hypothetical protein KatS3mg103_0401 [Phycisphaerales bacterium]